MKHGILEVAKQMFFAKVTECTLSSTVSTRVNPPTRQTALAWQAELEKHAHGQLWEQRGGGACT